ncbi:hypothetical protein [Nocardia paucivorans]|uniref:hypothetical protein n=1 Tax=Nocardia paucivorans TaxID=114259 RepID=UPI00030DA36A|nr:hypothetical protein [Nocardia paucivorans]
MQRGSSKHGPARDDELAHELQGTPRANRAGPAEEWHDPDSPVDDSIVQERIDRTERPYQYTPKTAD